MGFTDQDIPTPLAAPPVRLPGELTVESITRPAADTRVNWLFSGVLLGAASWLLVLGGVFAAFGNWIVAGGMLGGILLCGLAIWRATRRLARVNAPGRHRA